MKIQNTPSFKAKTNILSHNNILSAEKISRLKKIGESIGTNEDSIYFNIRNFKKNKIVILQETKLKLPQKDIEITTSVMSHKWLLKPEKYIEKILTGINNIVCK